MKRPRLVLADEHTLMLEGLQKLLEPEFEVAGLAGDGRALVTLASTTKADLALLEIALPLLNGIDVLIQLRRKSPRTRTIFLTAWSDRQHVTEAIRAGAAGYVLKSGTAVELRTAIREVMRGRSYISPLIANELLTTFRSALSPAAGPTLTPRQREIVQLVAEGFSLKEMSKMLNVSQKTVEYHKYGMMQKLGLRTNADIVQYAMQQAIVSRQRSPKQAPRES
jgi:DNA-binding NarL/FixJ family response regulator